MIFSIFLVFTFIMLLKIKGILVNAVDFGYCRVYLTELYRFTHKSDITRNI